MFSDSAGSMRTTRSLRSGPRSGWSHSRVKAYCSFDAPPLSQRPASTRKSPDTCARRKDVVAEAISASVGIW